MPGPCCKTGAKCQGAACDCGADCKCGPECACAANKPKTQDSGSDLPDTNKK